MKRDFGQFVRRENVRHYQRLLEYVTDEAERHCIARLLSEEQIKQHGVNDLLDNDPNRPLQLTVQSRTGQRRLP